jgi:hypothetical protein
MFTMMKATTAEAFRGPIFGSRAVCDSSRSTAPDVTLYRSIQSEGAALPLPSNAFSPGS